MDILNNLYGKHKFIFYRVQLNSLNMYMNTVVCYFDNDVENNKYYKILYWIFIKRKLSKVLVKVKIDYI